MLRGFNFCVIDEVDSILIDEARTPLIISGPADKPSEKYYRVGFWFGGGGCSPPRCCRVGGVCSPLWSAAKWVQCPPCCWEPCYLPDTSHSTPDPSPQAHLTLDP